MRLRLGRPLLIIFLISIVAVSFVTVIERQKSSISPEAHPSVSASSATASPIQNCFLTVPEAAHSYLTTPQFFASVTVFDVDLLNNSVRLDIYTFIKSYPGTQFRGICTQLGLSIGLVQYHLDILTKAGFISFIYEGRYKRYFESGRFSMSEMKIISLMRHETIRNILTTLLDDKQVSHGELSSLLSITSQGLIWQMKRLHKAGLIQIEKEELRNIYSLDEKCVPILRKYVNLIEGR